MTARPLRFLICTGVFPPAIGGPALQSDLIATELAKRGQDVCVVTFGTMTPIERKFRIEYLDQPRGRTIIGRIARNYRIYRQLRELLGVFDPDVIQIQTLAGVLPLLMLVAARRSRAVSYVKYASDPVDDFINRKRGVRNRTIRPGPLLRFRGMGHELLARLVLRNAGHVWTTTSAMADFVARRWRVPAEKVVLDPNLFDLEHFKGAGEARASGMHDPVRLLVLGRLQAVKGVDVAISAMKVLGKGFVLRVVGEGAPGYEEELAELATKLGVEDRIQMAGPCDAAGLPAQYEWADMLVLPSRNESFGNVLVEAMASGVPIVASDVGGIPSVVQSGIHAILVPPEDPSGLARAIEELARNNGLRERLVANGRLRSEDFSAEAGIDRWILRGVAAREALSVLSHPLRAIGGRDRH